MGLQDFGLTLRNPDFVKLAEVLCACDEHGMCLRRGQWPTHCGKVSI